MFIRDQKEQKCNSNGKDIYVHDETIQMKNKTINEYKLLHEQNVFKNSLNKTYDDLEKDE